MPVYEKRAGAWKQIKSVYYNLNGSWKTIQTGHEKQGGIWRQVYNKSEEDFKEAKVAIVGADRIGKYTVDAETKVFRLYFPVPRTDAKITCGLEWNILNIGDIVKFEWSGTLYNSYTRLLRANQSYTIKYTSSFSKTITTINVTSAIKADQNVLTFGLYGNNASGGASSQGSELLIYSFSINEQKYKITSIQS